jgi:Protein of unknown function (DUF1566)
MPLRRGLTDALAPLANVRDLRLTNQPIRTPPTGGRSMKTLVLTIAAVMIAILAITAGPIRAATSNGPYYATPSWDQQLDCTDTANCPRFIKLSNWIDASHPSGGAAVLDRETGLVWEQSPSTSRVLFDSGFCNDKNVGNRKGWRLPTIQELASLVDPTVASPGPTLPAGHPFSNVQSSLYWSATDSGLAFTGCLPGGGCPLHWVVDFSGVSGVARSNGDAFIWCVRGGQGVNPQGAI